MTKMIKPKKSKKQPANARIFFILDRSGSMGCIADETIGGFNAFVETIPFEQARRYVMRVLSDAEIYRRLTAAH